MSHRVVKARPQKQQQLIRLAVAVLSLLLAWGLFEFGRYQAGYNLIDAVEQRHEQSKSLDKLKVENTRLREQNAILERSDQIENEAYKQLEGTVNALQDEILELKEELAFYRGIVSPDDANKGLNLQSFELKAGREARTFHYKMVLTQVLSNGSLAYGNIDFTVEGSLEGTAKKLSLAQLGGDSKRLDFRFKYFQAFEGDISLPEGFIPSKVNLVVKPRSRKHKELTESIDWVVQES